MTRPGPDLLGLLGALGRMGSFRNPLEEALRREGLSTDEYLRYWRLQPADRQRLADEGVEWVKRCQEFDERTKQRMQAAAERRSAEFQQMVGEIGAEVQNLLGERFAKGRTFIDFTIFDQPRPAGNNDDIWAEAVDLPEEDDVYRGDAAPEAPAEAGTAAEADGAEAAEAEAAGTESDEAGDADAPEAPKPSKQEKLVEALERLAALKDAGHIDDAEFKKAKKKLLK